MTARRRTRTRSWFWPRAARLSARRPGAADLLRRRAATWSASGSGTRTPGRTRESWSRDWSPRRSRTAGPTAACTWSRRSSPPATRDRRRALVRASAADLRAPDPRRGGPARLAAARALHTGLAAAAGLPRRSARRSVPAVRLHHRPLARVVAAAAARRVGAARPAGLAAARRSGAVRRGGAPRAGRSTAPTVSSTRSPGTTSRWCGPGCTGWSPRRSRPPRCCGPHRRAGLRRLVPHLLGLRRAVPDRPRPGQLAPRTRRRQPAGRPRSGAASPTSTTPTRRCSLPALPLRPTLAGAVAEAARTAHRTRPRAGPHRDRGGRRGRHRPGRRWRRRARTAPYRVARRPTSRWRWPGCGQPVRLLARLSDDAFGRRLRTHLAGNGVDLSWAVPAPNRPRSRSRRWTGRARRVRLLSRRHRRLAVEDSDELPVADAAGGRAAHRVAGARRCRPAIACWNDCSTPSTTRPVTISIDLNLRPSIVGDVTPSAAESTARSGTRTWSRPATRTSPGSTRAARSTRSRPAGGPPESPAASSRSALGVRTCSGRPEWRTIRPARPIDVVDTVGAGDAFTGGLLAALATIGALGSEPGPAAGRGDAAAVAVRARPRQRRGRMTCTRRGADPPTKAERSWRRCGRGNRSAFQDLLERNQVGEHGIRVAVEVLVTRRLKPLAV